MALLPVCQKQKNENTSYSYVSISKTLLGSFFYSLQYLDVKLVHYFNIETNINIIIWMRGFVGIIGCLLFICILRIRPWYGKNIKGLLLRGMFGSFSLLCSFHSLLYLPLSIATVFFSLTPLWTALYCSLYKIDFEKSENVFSWKRKYTYSCTVCLSGVIIISLPLWFHRSQLELLGKGYIYAIFSSLFQCAVNVSILSLENEHSLITSFYSMTQTVLFVSLWGYHFFPQVSNIFYNFGFNLPTLLFYSMGVCSLLAQTLKTCALQTSKGLTIIVLRYVDIPLALMWDLLLFHHRFTIYEIVGISLIGIGLGIYFF
jgi:drug/metabolite transporter (DMT)-like permease